MEITTTQIGTVVTTSAFARARFECPQSTNRRLLADTLKGLQGSTLPSVDKSAVATFARSARISGTAIVLPDLMATLTAAAPGFGPFAGYTPINTSKDVAHAPGGRPPV